MTLTEAIQARHSVRHYLHKPLPPEIIGEIERMVGECNRPPGRLRIQLVTDEPRGFSGLMAYGKFSGVENYLVMAGAKEEELDERVGYRGEQLVLLAQQLGLNTCWAGLSYRKVSGAFTLEKGEKVACMIALGYGAEQGHPHKSKRPEQVSNLSETSPEWFRRGVEAALLAPTAINQQKFYLEYKAPGKVTARRLFSVIGYTEMDLGIVKCHFEAAAGKDNFEWV